jgi:hypothetical protein
VAAYRKDQHVIFDKVKAGTGVQLMAGTDYIQEHLGDVTFPVLILHGGDDWLCASSAGRSLGCMLTHVWIGQVTSRARTCCTRAASRRTRRCVCTTTLTM